MEKKLKLLILALTSILMMSFSVNAKDYGLGYYNGGYSDSDLTVTEVDGKECLKFTPSSTSTYKTAFLSVNPDSVIPEKTILSFDVSPAQTHQYMFIQILGSENTSIGELIFSQDGKMAYRTTPSWESIHTFPDGNDAYSGYNIVDITSGEWYHIDIVFDYSNGTTAYFLDGETWGSGGKFDKTKYLYGFYVTGKGGEGYNDAYTGAEAFYFDDITCYLLDKNTIDASMGKIDYTAKTIDVILSELPRSAIESGKVKLINTVSGDNADIKSIEQKNNIITITYKDDLMESTEYAVELSEGIKGKFGGISKKKILYFQTPDGGTASDPVFTNAVEDDFDDEQSTFSWKPGWSPDVEYVDEAGRGKVLGIKFANKAAAVETNINFSGIDKYFNSDSDVKYLSFDLKAASLRNLSISLVTSGWSYPLSLYTSEKGWFWGSTWTPAQSGGDLHSIVFPATKAQMEEWGYRGFADMNKDTWYNIKFSFDSENEKLGVYVNNVLLQEISYTQTAFNSIDRVLIRNCSAETNNTVNVLYIDNVIIANGTIVRNNKVKNIRFVNSEGTTFGPYDDISRDLNKVILNFYDEIDKTTLTTDTVKIFYNESPVGYTPIASDGYSYTLMPNALPGKGEKIKVEVSGVYNVKKQQVPDYATICFADTEEGILKIVGFQLVDSDGKVTEDKDGTRYAKVSIYNTQEAERKVIVSLTGYSDKKMTYLDFKEYSLKSGNVVILDESVNNETLKIASVENYTNVQTVVLDGGNKHYPISEPKEIVLGPELTEYDVTKAENVRILGRGSKDANGARTFNWPNSGIEFKFDGTTAAVNVTDITFDTDGGDEGNYFNVQVDGGEPQRIKMKAGRNVICENLAEGQTHSVKMVRSSEAYRGTIRIDHLLTDSEPTATTEKDKKILFIGDSYTAGYGNVPELSDCTWGCAKNTDNWYSYAGYVMRKLDADGDVLAYQGKGLATNGDGTTENNMASQFTKSDIYVDDAGFLGNLNGYTQSTEVWNFEEKAPQLIAIWLGTNDYLGTKGNAGAAFKTAYVDFLGNVKNKYPNATVICCSRPEEGQYYSEEVEEAVEQIGGAINGYYYLKFNTFSGSGIYGHPNKAEHQVIANELITKINSISGVWE